MTFTVALTGHRPRKLGGYRLDTPFYRALHARLSDIIDLGLAKHQHLTLRSGMALGADTIWAEAIVQARGRHPGRVAFVADVPVMSQSDLWTDAASRKRWRELVDSADQLVVYADRYSPACLHERNRGMISSADMLIAVWDGSPGGTAHGVRIANEHNIPTYTIHPNEIRAFAAARESNPHEG